MSQCNRKERNLKLSQSHNKTNNFSNLSISFLLSANSQQPTADGSSFTAPRPMQLWTVESIWMDPFNNSHQNTKKKKIETQKTSMSPNTLSWAPTEYKPGKPTPGVSPHWDKSPSGGSAGWSVVLPTLPRHLTSQPTPKQESPISYREWSSQSLAVPGTILCDNYQKLCKPSAESHHLAQDILNQLHLKLGSSH